MSDLSKQNPAVHGGSMINWQVDWDEIAAIERRALYRQGGFLFMVSESGCLFPYIYKIGQEARDHFARQVAHWEGNPALQVWRKS